jgi:hypothetical protein
MDHEVAQLVEHWVLEVERDTSPDEAAQSETQSRLPITSTGLLSTFTDSIGGSVSLEQGNGRLRHRGTVAVRGRCASIDTAGKNVALPDHVMRAFEFVASWFGFPFDAVNLRASEREVLSWGFWGLAGTELAGCLHQWKRQAPDTFANYLTAFGIDVADGPMLRVQFDGETAEGRGAEWAIATEPRLLAALARAGRDASAQQAQLDTVLANWVKPVSMQPWTRSAAGTATTADTLKSAAHMAVLLYLIRRYGRRATLRLMHTVHTRCRPENDQDAWLIGLVRALKNLRREHDSSEVLRISSSPELTAA